MFSLQFTCYLNNLSNIIVRCVQSETVFTSNVKEKRNLCLYACNFNFVCTRMFLPRREITNVKCWSCNDSDGSIYFFEWHKYIRKNVNNFKYCINTLIHEYWLGRFENFSSGFFFQSTTHKCILIAQSVIWSARLAEHKCANESWESSQQTVLFHFRMQTHLYPCLYEDFFLFYIDV